MERQARPTTVEEKEVGIIGVNELKSELQLYIRRRSQPVVIVNICIHVFYLVSL